MFTKSVHWATGVVPSFLALESQTKTGKRTGDEEATRLDWTAGRCDLPSTSAHSVGFILKFKLVAVTPVPVWLRSRSVRG